MRPTEGQGDGAPTLSRLSQAQHFTFVPSPSGVGGTHCCACLTDGETEVEEPALGHTGARPGACSLYHTVTHSRPVCRAASSCTCHILLTRHENCLKLFSPDNTRFHKGSPDTCLL